MIDELVVKYILKYITKNFNYTELIKKGYGKTDFDFMQKLIMVIMKEQLDLVLALSILEPVVNEKFTILNEMQEITSRIKYKKTDKELNRYIALFDIDITEIEKDVMYIITQAINQDRENKLKLLEVGYVG